MSKKPPEQGRAEIRKNIDNIDEQILKLLSRRGKLARKVIQFKKVYYDPKRESEVLQRLFELNQGPLGNDAVTSIYREIMSACRNLQKPLTIAFLGPQATFSHAAVLKKFGGSITELPCPDIPSVFDEVEKESADFGVVPFENSTEGVISYSIDRFAQTPLIICGEIYIDVALYVLSLEDGMDKVKSIYAQPKTIDQCGAWLRTAGKEIIQVNSTGLAAKMAASQKGTAAIASKIAAGIYGLKIIKQRVEDSRDNKTRFLVIGRQTSEKTGRDKTSILFSVRHEPGTLYRALKAFEKQEINLTMMQARPSHLGQWEYIFFVDAQGHTGDKQLQNCINEMKKETILLKIMGSYPEDAK